MRSPNLAECVLQVCNRRWPLRQTQAPYVLPRRLGLRNTRQPGGCRRSLLLPRHSRWAFLASGPAWHVGQGGWSGKHPLCWSLGARGEFGAALQQGEGWFALFRYCQCGWGRRPQSQALSQRLAWGLLSGGGFNDPGRGPGRCRGAHRVCVAMGEY